MSQTRHFDMTCMKLWTEILDRRERFLELYTSVFISSSSAFSLHWGHNPGRKLLCFQSWKKLPPPLVDGVLEFSWWLEKQWDVCRTQKPCEAYQNTAPGCPGWISLRLHTAHQFSSKSIDSYFKAFTAWSTYKHFLSCIITKFSLPSKCVFLPNNPRTVLSFLDLLLTVRHFIDFQEHSGHRICRLALYPLLKKLVQMQLITQAPRLQVLNACKHSEMCPYNVFIFTLQWTTELFLSGILDLAVLSFLDLLITVRHSIHSQEHRICRLALHFLLKELVPMKLITQSQRLEELNACNYLTVSSSIIYTSQ